MKWKSKNLYDGRLSFADYLEQVVERVEATPACDSHLIQIPAPDGGEDLILEVTPASREEWIRDTRELIRKERGAA